MSLPIGYIMTPPSKRRKTSYLIAEDAGTVAHVYFDATGIHDTQGNSWAMQGTVPQVAASAPVPAGAGPFSDANHYSLGTGSDVLDFTGDFSACIVFGSASQNTTDKVLFNNGVSGTSGYYLETDNGVVGNTDVIFSTSGSAIPFCSSGALTGINVVCFGRAGSTAALQVNLGAYVWAATTAITAATSTPARIGRYASTGNPASTQTIYEMWFTTTTPSSALFSAVATAVKTKLGISAW